MADTSPNRVMLVMAHPDDAEFSSAGTMAKWAAAGMEITYVIITSGDKGSDDPDMTPEKLVEIREEEQRAAARVLGVKEVIYLRCPDGGVDDTPELREKIVRLMRVHQPDTLVTMDPLRRYNQHRDHRMAGTVALDAAFPYSRSHLYYPQHIAEGLRPCKIYEAYIAGAENSNVEVNISETFEKKIQALRCHVSQVPNLPEEEFKNHMIEMSKRMSGNAEGGHLRERFRRIEWRSRDRDGRTPPALPDVPPPSTGSEEAISEVMTPPIVEALSEGELPRES